MATDMQDLVKFLAQSLVDNPDEVKVSEEERADETVIKLSVAPGDMARSLAGRAGSRKRSGRLLRPLL